MGYQYKLFRSVIDLVIFLNEEKIPKENIIAINSNNKDGTRELIYYKERVL